METLRDDDHVRKWGRLERTTAQLLLQVTAVLRLALLHIYLYAFGSVSITALGFLNYVLVFRLGQSSNNMRSSPKFRDLGSIYVSAISATVLGTTQLLMVLLATADMYYMYAEGYLGSLPRKHRGCSWRRQGSQVSREQLWLAQR